MKGRRGSKRLASNAITIQRKSLAHFNARSIGARSSQRRFSSSDQHPLQTNNKRNRLTLSGPSENSIATHCTIGQMAAPLEANLTEMDLIKSASRAHLWHWNEADKSHECLVSEDQLEVCFHPQCSESAAAIRGSEPLLRNGNYYYWEVTALDKTYGTSVMFGLCTKQQILHANDYCNLVGLDKSGWSLSHKGLIWHDGKNSQYTQMFPTNQTVTIGLLFNTMRGELSYFMDGKNLGVAFYGLNNVNSDLYPIIGSTAKCTRMRLTGAYCGYVSLLERSCFTLLQNARDRTQLVKQLHQYQIPKNLIKYLAEAAEVCGSQTEKTAQFDQCNWNDNHPSREC